MNDYNSIIYDMPTQSELSNMLGFGISVIIFYIIFIIAFCILLGGGIAGQSHMFAKTGEAPWKAVIPFYNLYILFDLSWNRHMFWFWLCGTVAYIGGNLIVFLKLIASSIVSLYTYSTTDISLIETGIGTSIGLSLLAFAGFIVMLVFQIILSIKVARSFGKGGGYACGLFFLPSIFYMILGFGSALYRDGNQPSLKEQKQYREDEYRYTEEMHVQDKA